jgi:hypothetical protein
MGNILQTAICKYTFDVKEMFPSVRYEKSCSILIPTKNSQATKIVEVVP